MLTQEAPARTLERVNLLLTPNAVDDALANGVTGVEPNPSNLDRFLTSQFDSAFAATELTIIMRQGRRDGRFAEGDLPVYGDIRRLGEGELDYVSRRDIDPATVVEMDVTLWDNYPLGFQLFLGMAKQRHDALRVARDRRTLMLGDIAASQGLLGLIHDNKVMIGYGLLTSAAAAWARKKDNEKVRMTTISAPMAQYYNNFTVTRAESAEA